MNWNSRQAEEFGEALNQKRSILAISFPWSHSLGFENLATAFGTLDRIRVIGGRKALFLSHQEFGYGLDPVIDT